MSLCSDVSSGYYPLDSCGQLEPLFAIMTVSADTATWCTVSQKKPKRQPYTQRFAWKFQVEMYGQGCRTLGIWFGKLGQELRIKKTSAMMLHAVEHCSMSSAPNLAVKFISVTFGNWNAKFEFSNLSYFQLGSTKQSNSTAEIGRQGPAV